MKAYFPITTWPALFFLALGVLFFLARVRDASIGAFACAIVSVGLAQLFKMWVMKGNGSAARSKEKQAKINQLWGRR